jgi:sugar phosphate isomerase/epimerase
MKLAISNICFNDSNKLQVLKSCSEHGISNIEYAFSKINDISDSDLLKFNHKSCQSLFYNSDIKSFSEEDLVHNHLLKVLDGVGVFGTDILVLGSPSLRTPGSKNSLLKTLSKIDPILREKNVFICIEPNCKEYSGSYFFDLEEIVSSILSYQFTNIKTMIDTHNLILEGHDPTNQFNEYVDHIYHIHASEPSLGNFMPSDEHYRLSRELKQCRNPYNSPGGLFSTEYERIITYEVKDNLNLIQSVKSFANIYK